MPAQAIDPSKQTEYSTQSRRSNKEATNSFSVKSALNRLTKSSSDWHDADGKANGHLYSLLGEVYETTAQVDGNASAISALRKECEAVKHIKSSKMFDVKKRKPIELLIAYAIGNTDNDSRRSQWKRTLERAADKRVKPDKVSLVKWLDSVGGIEGAITNGKQKAQNKAKLAAKVDHKGLLDSILSLYTLDNVKLRLDADVSTAKSFGDDSFIDRYALVVVVREENPDTAERTYSILDVVNDKALLGEAAEVIAAENSRNAKSTKH